MQRIILIFICLGFLNELSAQINSSSFAAKVDFNLNGNGSTWLGAVADLDADGKKDIIATQDSANIGYMRIFKNVSTSGSINTSSLLPYKSIAGPISTAVVAVGDIDGDGSVDLVSSPFYGTSIASSFSCYLNNNITNTISFSFALKVNLPNCFSDVFLEDIDGDGKKDLIGTMWHQSGYRIYRNTSTQGSISFDTVNYYSGSAGTYAAFFACTDLNNDSKPDIAICNYGNNDVRVYKNTSTVGSISLSTAVILAAGSNSSRIDVNDIDSDGKKDLIVSNTNSGTIGIYKNNSTLASLSFSPATTFSSVSINGPVRLQCADFDKDGKSDIAVGNYQQSSVSVFKNFAEAGIINSNTIGGRKQYTSGASPEVYVADIDGDTAQDIIAFNRGAGTISILRNQITPSGNLVAWYQMKGNGADSSGYENHGTATGVTTTTDRNGNTNSAYTFDGTSADYISVPANMSFNPSTNANMLFTCWFKPGTSTTTLARRIFNLQDGSNRNYDLSFDYQTRKLIFINFNGTSYAVNITSTMTFTAGTWYHVAVRIDSANNSSVFVNGVPEMSSTNTLTKPINPTLNIGRHATQGWNFIGDIDEMKIYTKYVPNAGISALYNSETSRRYYYSKATGNLNQLSTWGTNTDGSGVSPLSFDSANTTYVVVNNSNPQTGGSFKIPGNGSVLVLGNGSNTFNLVLGSSDTLLCDSVYIYDNITVTVQGRFITNKLNAALSSNVQYISSLPQFMASGTYGSVVIASGTKTLTGNTIVRNNFGMAASLNTIGHSFTLGQSTSETGVLNYNQGTINGKLTRWFATSINSGNTGLFPIGTATKYLPFMVEFSSAPTTGGTVAAEFVASNPGNVGLPVTDFSSGFLFIDKAAPEGYWKITSAINTGTFKATATANNFAGVNVFADLRMLRRNTGGAWSAPGTSIPGTGSNASVVLARTGLTALDGEYGVGGDQSQNPLPVKLVSFTAQKADERSCVVGWSTVSEINADRFVVERSSDLARWENRAEVKAAGNSSEKVSYKILDNIDGFSGNTLYYRLVQFDYNGDQYISNVVSIISDKATYEDVSLSVYPNPASDEIIIDGNNSTEGIIYNSLGQTVKTFSTGSVNISDLQGGIYFIQVGHRMIRFVKRNMP